MGAATSAADRSTCSTPNRSSIASRLSHGASTLPENDVTYRDKKKKASKFATLRKKLIRVRRQSRTMDYSKVIRDMTSSWSVRELRALVDDYEALAVLKELTLCANLARPPLNTLRTDLAMLFDQRYCTDINLMYHNTCIPSHRAILSVRCPFFRELLSRYPQFGATVTVKVRTSGVDVATFTALLRYLYTDELNTSGTRLDNSKVLNKLINEFGLPNPLENDMRTLLDFGVYSDAVLVFTPDSDYNTFDDQNFHAGSPSVNKHELRCHKAILAARSVFFRNLLERRARSVDSNLSNSTTSIPYQILLDESVIPKQYARVLLQTIYTDCVDLSCIVRSSVSMCSLSEVQAIVAGKGHVTRVDEAMEIYQIGQFLDLPVLSQGCEDIIADSLTTDNLISILDWSIEAHGSRWVHRQALHYMREELVQLAHSSVLNDLSKEYLIAAIKSPFIQATELDILTAVLKWGENRLMKRMEEREPNLLTHTAHSVAKKGIKKRDLNDIELREILADVLPYVCIDHVLPPNSEVLTNMIRRGLISTPPSHMIGGETPANQVQAWVRESSTHGVYTRPRYFLPYHEEVKAQLEERLHQSEEQDDVRMVRMSSIPDTLYMVDEHQYTQHTSHLIPGSVSTVDIIAGSIPVPNEPTLQAMLHCEQSLQQSPLARRAYSLSHTDKRAVSYQIDLRVVREFGLPDSTVQVLQKKPHYYNDVHFHERQFDTYESFIVISPLEDKRAVSYQIDLRVVREFGLPDSTVQVLQKKPHYYDDVHFDERHFKPIKCPPKRAQASRSAPISPVRGFTRKSGESSGATNDTVVREMMPDIAMATVPHTQQLSLDNVTIHDTELVLDLGDGDRQGTLYL